MYSILERVHHHRDQESGVEEGEEDEGVGGLSGSTLKRLFEVVGEKESGLLVKKEGEGDDDLLERVMKAIESLDEDEILQCMSEEEIRRGATSVRLASIPWWEKSDGDGDGDGEREWVGKGLMRIPSSLDPRAAFGVLDCVMAYVGVVRTFGWKTREEEDEVPMWVGICADVEVEVAGVVRGEESLLVPIAERIARCCETLRAAGCSEMQALADTAIILSSPRSTAKALFHLQQTLPPPSSPPPPSPLVRVARRITFLRAAIAQLQTTLTHKLGTHVAAAIDQRLAHTTPTTPTSTPTPASGFIDADELD